MDFSGKLWKINILPVADSFLSGLFKKYVKKCYFY